jgi:hypothetical protein
MIPEYHKLLMHDTCGAYFDDQELNEVINGNMGQDGIAGQNGHPEYHFDDSEFKRSFAYLAEQRSKVIENVKSGTNYREARAAYGRFTHGHQDFYAHSNYVRLWAKKHHVKRLQGRRDHHQPGINFRTFLQPMGDDHINSNNRTFFHSILPQGFTCLHEYRFTL